MIVIFRQKLQEAQAAARNAETELAAVESLNTTPSPEVIQPWPKRARTDKSPREKGPEVDDAVRFFAST